ncbi:hypothetical protein GCM10011579_086560 [Streptomyces albiflavescens]|uniref:MmpS family membrane protein n=1 Tax=Streptomyces albiflavescens TaxID=1623582 RepID=A0A917YE01_9ACTN|nr:hypothetical protein [Streptomyces albiflavescens]GGN90570.1 hypothetical protein GCM10011579_086560 [Streptomyces albiflavescens]
MPSTRKPDDAETPEVADSPGVAETPEVAEDNSPEVSGEKSPESSSKGSSKGADRRGIVVGGVLLAASAGVVVYGVLNTAEKPEQHHVPTAAVTYEIEGEGTADITYQARSESGDAMVANGVTLPWKKTVNVPLGKAPLVTITLGEKGGRASCQLAVRGKHVQTATAFGKFGRATCQGELPAPEPSDADAAGQEGS